MSMAFDPQAVDIFTHDAGDTTKYRICVGYVLGDQLYYMRKFGYLYPKHEHDVHPEQRIIEAARNAYDNIPERGDFRIVVYGYDFGMPCDFDDQGLPIGHWPKIGDLVLKYDGKFLLPSGKLPSGYEHLRPLAIRMF
jgi:hypothetical protein